MNKRLLLREVDLMDEEAEILAKASAPPIDQQWAVVVGVGSYASPIVALDNAAGDATAVAELLVREYGVKLLPAGQPLLDGRASLSAISGAIKDNLQRATETTRWVFYFAGHGRVLDRQGYLLPIDAQDDEPGTYLSINALIEACLNSACAETLIILDACYAGRALVHPDNLSDLIRDELDRERVRQIITSGNPAQPVLDGGGSGHSVFTQSLLDALEGWAGIHDLDGTIRYARLLDHLVFDVPGRLRALGLNAARQQPIGGNLTGNPSSRGIMFQPSVPRLDPLIVRDGHSDDPSRRRDSLSRSVNIADELRPLAVELALRHLRRETDASAGPFMSRTLRYEPVVEVRAQAAATLGALRSELAVESLIAALDDDPAVCRAAAGALGKLHEQRAAAPLLERLRHADDELFLDLVAAIGAIGDLAVTTEMLREALRRGQLVPFVGPDFSHTLTGLPNRATVARELARREHLLVDNSLADNSLAETAAATMRGSQNRFIFTSFLKRALDDQLVRPGVIYGALTKLSAQFWISGTYDALLPRALGANTIVSGGDTQYWKQDRPTVMRLAGDLARPESLVVLMDDYKQLREIEGDRKLLVSYLRNEISGKVVLFLGYDPDSSDFALLVEHVLNDHLVGIDVRAFLVWPQQNQSRIWNRHPINVIGTDPLAVVQQLAADVPG